MSTCDNTTLANFELPWIDHGEREFALLDNRPPFLATCDPFTKVARISYGKFDQVRSPIQSAFRREVACRVWPGAEPDHDAQRLSQAAAAAYRMIVPRPVTAVRLNE